MWKRYTAFIRGVSVNWIGRLGVVLTTSSFVVLLFHEITRLSGVVSNSYVGLVTYLLFPALFVLGLILIPIGWRQLKRKTGLSGKELMQRQFDQQATTGSFFGSRLFLTIALLSVGNIVFLGIVSNQMLHFMDSARFCGTACHSVMHPEWATYQRSPHARVACVECHVGEGVDALVASKLNGLYQIISVTFNLYEKPIPTPVHQLRPARQTCEKCHWPAKFYGERIIRRAYYDNDSLSTPSYTTLNLTIDGHREVGRSGIHWHIAEENMVRYASIDDERKEMIWVEFIRPDSSVIRYTNPEYADRSEEHDQVRTMDCVDCHNRATHIYQNPDRAINELIGHGFLSRELPYIKREALAAVTTRLDDTTAGLNAIENHITGYYQRRFPDLLVSMRTEVDSAVAVLQQLYRTNVFPQMNIFWGAYPSHIGHEESPGCFRCHNSDLESADGQTISDDCELCHALLAYESDEPYEFLNAPDTSSREYALHEYHHNLFLSSHQKKTAAARRY